MTEPTFDHERLDVSRLSMDYVAFQRIEAVSEGSIEYEYEYRDAEYEYEEDNTANF